PTCFRTFHATRAYGEHTEKSATHRGRARRVAPDAGAIAHRRPRFAEIHAGSDPSGCAVEPHAQPRFMRFASTMRNANTIRRSQVVDQSTSSVDPPDIR